MYIHVFGMYMHVTCVCVFVACTCMLFICVYVACTVYMHVYSMLLYSTCDAGCRHALFLTSGQDASTRDHHDRANVKRHSRSVYYGLIASYCSFFLPPLFISTRTHAKSF